MPIILFATLFFMYSTIYIEIHKKNIRLSKMYSLPYRVR